MDKEKYLGKFAVGRRFRESLSYRSTENYDTKEELLRVHPNDQVVLAFITREPE